MIKRIIFKEDTEVQNKMNYIEAAKIILRAKLSDIDDEKLIDLYLLLVFTVGKNCTQKDVHDAWSIWKNMINPDHKSLIEFDLLDKDVQFLDEPYRIAIVSTANEINGNKDD
jgi:hypothetical protein